MCEAFAGLGSDIEISSGTRLSPWHQQQLGMMFLTNIRNYFGRRTMNEVLSYCFVMNSTIVGDRVGVKDVSAELSIPMSTTSHVISMLQQLEYLEAYCCATDQRRKWLRMHPRMVQKRMSGQDCGEDPWANIRRNLAQMLTSMSNSS